MDTTISTSVMTLYTHLAFSFHGLLFDTYCLHFLLDYKTVSETPPLVSNFLLTFYSFPTFSEVSYLLVELAVRPLVFPGPYDRASS